MTPTDPTTPTEINADKPTNETDTIGAASHTAVGVLTEMQNLDTYYARDIEEVIDGIEAGVERPGVAKTAAGERAADAVERLKELKPAAPDEREGLIREALADLAPVAADVADHDTITDADVDTDIDGNADGDISLLAAAVTAREMLQDVDPATVDDN